MSARGACAAGNAGDRISLCWYIGAEIDRAFANLAEKRIAMVAVRILIPATQNFDLQRRIADGTRVAVVSLVSTPVLVVTLMLASRRSGSNVLAYLGLDIPRWRHIAITGAGLAIWIVFFDVLTLALGRDMVPPWMLDIRRSAQADGLPGLEERTSRAINSQDEIPFLAHISGESFLTWPLPFKMNRVNRRGGVERVACD